MRRGQPGSDRVEINAGAKQVGRGRVANRMWADSLGLKRRGPFRRSVRMTGHERINPKARHGLAVSVEEQRTGGIATPDERLEFRHCLFRERAKANFPTLTLVLHRTSSGRVPS